MATSFKKPNTAKKIDPEAADKLAEELADKTYDKPAKASNKNEQRTMPPEDETKSLQFKITPSLHMEFKTYASARGMKMVDLFKKMFDEYKENHQ